MQRRTFVRIAVLSGVSTAIEFSLSSRKKIQPAEQRVRIRPITGVNYSQGFLKFASASSFASASEAIASVKNPRTPFDIVWD